jgi:alpha-glucosidase
MKTLICLVILLSGPAFAGQMLKSPDGQVTTGIFMENEHLSLKVERNSRDVLLPSPVGIVLHGTDLGKNAEIVSTTRYSVNEQYPWHGNHSTAVNRCNGVKYHLKTEDVQWLLNVRVYNDGVAFKFSVDRDKAMFNGESTVLKFDPSLTAKYMRHRMSEESRVYTLAVADIARQKYNRTLPPLLMYPKDASHYIMVLEGGGFNFHGYSLLAQKDATFEVDYAEKPGGWKIGAGIETAWKIVCTVDTLNELVNTDLVPNVCPAPDPALFPKGMNEPWIKPGKSTWNWWARISCKFEEQVKLVDLGANMGADYHLVDIGWDQKWQNKTKSAYDYLKQLCDYAATKDIGIWVWKASDVSLNLELTRDSGKSKFQPLEAVHIPLEVHAMRAEVKRIAEAGAKGIKLDYIQSEDSKWKTYMENFLKVCAEQKLMVDFHGCPTPAGESRTYPNELTREAIYGGEKLRGGGGAEKKPTAQYIDLLFTRLIAGHADYTPSIFSHPQGEGFTHAMQLASAMMFTSPLLCWADHPEQYLASDSLEIIKTLPTVWDETRVLPGSRLSDLAVFARRRGNDWYVAGINGLGDHKQSYTLTLELDLLENDFDGNGDEMVLEQVDEITKQGGTVEPLSAGQIRYMPKPGFLGMDEFGYHVSDSTGLTNRQGYVKIYVRNPGLATHLLLDEQSGSLVHDVGPYQAHGRLTDGLSFSNSVAGKIGYALEMPDNAPEKASVDCDHTGDPVDGDLSVSLWVKYRTPPQENGVLICKGGTVIGSRFNNPRGGWFIGHVGKQGFRFGGNLQRNRYGEEDEKFNRESNRKITANQWYHLVMVLDRTNRQIHAWVNNQQITRSTWTSEIPEGIIEVSHQPLVIFNTQDQQSHGGGCIIDDVRIYNQSLNHEDVALLYQAKDEIPAGAPLPPVHGVLARGQAHLTWMPGKPDGVYQFEIYLGTDKEVVTHAGTDSGFYLGRLQEPSFDTDVLAGTSYYWRVDSVNGPNVIKGDVWSFVTASEFIEDYRLDFGLGGSTLEPRFSAIGLNQEIILGSASFILTSSDHVLASIKSHNNDNRLLMDYVATNASKNSQLVLTFSGVATGRYQLKSHQWIHHQYDVPQESYLVEQGRSTRLISFAKEVKSMMPYEGTVHLESHKTHTFVIQERNNVNQAYIAGFELIKLN